MTGERSAGSSAPAAALGASSQLPRVQRATTRPVASVVSNSAFGIDSDSSPRRWRAEAGDAACAFSSAVSSPSAAAPGGQLLHLLQEQPARDLQAAHGLELDALLDAGEDEQHGDRGDGDDRSQGRDDQDRRQPAPQAVAPHRRATGSDQTLAPRPSHSAARKMLDWRRLPLDALILRLLPDPRVPPDDRPLFVSGPRFPSAPALPSRG